MISILYQMQWRYKNGEVAIVAQQEIGTANELKSWQEKIIKEWSLPKDAEWLVCNEKSEKFAWAIEEKERK